jgi:transcriptional regulator GlxA family with amidase domain
MQRLARLASAAFLAICCLPALAATSAPPKVPTKTIGILVFDGFLTSEVTAPLEVFGAATKHTEMSDYRVLLISATHEKEVRSEEGLRMVADQTIYDPAHVDVLIVPSSYHMNPLLENADIVGFIQAQNRNASFMASNCSGAFLLGKAGVLDGKKATTWAGGEKDLAKAFPKIDVQVDRNVVVDGRVVTSNGGR